MQITEIEMGKRAPVCLLKVLHSNLCDIVVAFIEGGLLSQSYLIWWTSSSVKFLTPSSLILLQPEWMKWVQKYAL
jgi:hypothetical protein